MWLYWGGNYGKKEFSSYLISFYLSVHIFSLAKLNKNFKTFFINVLSFIYIIPGWINFYQHEIMVNHMDNQSATMGV